MKVFSFLGLVLAALLASSLRTSNDDLHEQDDDDKTRDGLFKLWMAAKRNLALSLKLETKVKVSDAMTLFREGDTHQCSERELFRRLTVEDLSNRVTDVYLTSPHRQEFRLPHHSNQPYGKYPSNLPFMATVQEQQVTFDELCGNITLWLGSPTRSSAERNQKNTSATLDFQHRLLQMVELLAVNGFSPMDEFSPCHSHSVDWFLDACHLADCKVIGALRILSRNESDLEAINKMRVLAHSENHPVAHMILARYYTIHVPDQDRVFAHAMQVIESMSGSVIDTQNGGVTERYARLSQVIHIPLVSTKLPLSGSPGNAFASHEQYLEHEAWLLSSLDNPDEYSETSDLLLLLGDFYVFGAPEIGVDPDYQLAKRYFNIALEQHGSGYAAAHLAAMSSTQDESSSIQDNRTAFILYEKAASLGEWLGYIGMGVFVEDGSVPDLAPQNDTRALELYRKAATQGSLSEGYYRAARLQHRMGDNTLCMENYRLACNAGHLASLYEFAFVIYYQNFKYDVSQAVRHALTAAKTDWSYQFPYDSSKAYARFVQGDESGALRLYDFARLGLFQTQAEMNVAYLLDVGHLTTPYVDVLQETEQPVYELGSHDTVERMALWLFPYSHRVSSKRRVDQMGRDRFRRAKQIYQVCANQHHIGEAFRKLAEFEDNVDKARELYTEGANMDDQESLWILGSFHMMGQGLEIDKDEANQYHEKCMQQSWICSVIVQLFKFGNMWIDRYV